MKKRVCLQKNQRRKKQQKGETQRRKIINVETAPLWLEGQYHHENPDWPNAEFAVDSDKVPSLNKHGYPTMHLFQFQQRDRREADRPEPGILCLPMNCVD